MFIMFRILVVCVTIAYVTCLYVYRMGPDVGHGLMIILYVIYLCDFMRVFICYMYIERVLMIDEYVPSGAQCRAGTDDRRCLLYV